MDITSQKRLAASILGVGVNRVRVDPEKLEKVEAALTRDDVRKLISIRVVTAKRSVGVSRGRARLLHKRRQKGKRRGVGSREGMKGARLNQHYAWVHSIRTIRRKLQYMKERKLVTPQVYRQLYGMAKGGSFRNLASLNRYVSSSGLLRRSGRRDASQLSS